MRMQGTSEFGRAGNSDIESTTLDGVVDSVALSRARARGVPVEAESILRLLVSQALACGVLLHDGGPIEPELGEQKYLIPQTRLFINKPKAVDLGWDMATAAALFVLTGSQPISFAATAFQRALRLMRVLTEEEADLAVVLAALSGGRPYDASVSIKRIETAYEEDRDKVKPMLDSMARRGLIAEGPHGWRLVL
jgi:hypothetical protein